MKKNLILNTYLNDQLLFKENLIGILENDILKYTSENNTFEINLKEETFLKENLESIFEIKKEMALITLKEVNKTFEINLHKYIFTNKENKIIIEYHLESNEPIKIEIEMSEEDA